MSSHRILDKERFQGYLGIPKIYRVKLWKKKERLRWNIQSITLITGDAETRGSGRDEFIKDVYEFESDKDALLMAISIQEEESVEDIIEELDDGYDTSEEDLKEILENVDYGFGSPVVFWIKNGLKKIYDTGLTKTIWNREF